MITTPPPPTPLSLWLFDFVPPYTLIHPFISGKLAWQQKILEVLSDSPLCHFSGGWWCHDLSPVSLQLRASRIRNLGTHFFEHLITCLCTRSCTSHFVHLKQSFVDVWMLTCTYYKDKNILEYRINLRSIKHQPRSWVYRVYRLFFVEQKQLQTCLLFKQNQKPDNFQLTLFESKSFPVCWFNNARLLANILIRILSLCRNRSFSQITCFDRYKPTWLQIYFDEFI